MLNHEILDRETEKKLILEYKLKGSEKARERLVKSNIKLIYSRVMKQSKKGIKNTTVDDLVSEGTVGLITAIDHFDPNRLLIDNGIRLSSYAIWWIDQAIMPAAINNFSIVHQLNKRRTKPIFNNINKSLAKYSLQIPLSHREVEIVAKDLACEVEDVIFVESILLGEVSLDSTYGEDGDQYALVDILSDPNVDVEKDAGVKLDIRNVAKVFEDSCKGITERDINILRDRLFHNEEFTLQELAYKYGTSKERIRQIQDKYEDLIVKRIRKRMKIKNVS
jgi:RNA polymerase sigma-32 factor